ncbi:YSC84-related protein [Nitrosococcus watsonii]|uniref:Ysc84 actin-binding domain-containing protein n=1 Tax=Nitrosococcus watsoni (strain C-113) TaxID=105559 RepID=D8K489_NITWC|nr:YSC84-related protein [Nitrosococcus watsonii]ADJ27786.1 conserved hypothetical protein [Nitrosococcus watsonii C-113]
MSTKILLSLFLATGVALMGCQSTGDTSSNLSEAAEIDREAVAALKTLYETSPSAKMLSTQAKAVLIFPTITKAGFIGAGKYGKGALREHGKTVAYYDIIAGSFGFQAGVQKYSYALFFMTDKALNYLDASKGWEIGTGPNIVVVDSGVAKNLSSTTAREGVYSFIFGEKGLMAGIDLEGSKISRINP